MVLAALLNACQLTGRALEDLQAVMVGAGAAGVAVAQDPASTPGVRDLVGLRLATARSTPAATTTQAAR